MMSDMICKTVIISLILFTWTVKCTVQIKRPENGVGSLLISHDDKEDNNVDVNKGRIMVFFDMECLANGEENSLDFNDDNDISLLQSIQESKVNSIISNHYPCLSHTTAKDGEIYHFSLSSRNTGISFLDINVDHSSQNSNSDKNKNNPPFNCLTDENFNKNVQLDYNEHCIKMATYEPMFELASSSAASASYDVLDSSKVTCHADYTYRDGLIHSPTSGEMYGYYYRWGLDLMDSSSLDDWYHYVDTSVDNGVDLHIIDTGIRSTHEEFLPGQVIHEFGNGPYKDDDDTTNTMYHGTHVAGTAGGKTFGLSRNLTIYDYDVFDYYNEVNNITHGDYATTLIGGFGYSMLVSFVKILKILKNGTNSDGENVGRRGVINMSLRGSKTVWTEYLEHYYEEIDNNGGIIVAAAGNDDADACSFAPAFSDHVITVGATWEHNKASFSNWGDCVDVWGPGYEICSAWAINDTAFDCWPGTSMASPAIAGVVANLLYVNPTLNRDQILSILKYNGEEVSDYECDSYYECKFARYDCFTLPQDILDESGTETNDISLSNPNNVVYNGSLLSEYASCKYIAVIEIDRSREDSSNFNNFAISSIQYEPIDTCISVGQGDGYIISQKIVCDSDSSATAYFYGNYGCSDDDILDKTTVYESGMIDNNNWYVVHCTSGNSNSNDSNDDDDDEFEDCSLIFRKWYPAEVIDNSYCEIKENSFRDSGYVNGACEVEYNDYFDPYSPASSSNIEYLFFKSFCLEMDNQLGFYTGMWFSLSDCLSTDINGTLLESKSNGQCTFTTSGDTVVATVYEIEYCSEEIAEGTAVVQISQSTESIDGNNNGNGNGHEHGSGGGSKSRHADEYGRVYSVIGIIIGCAIFMGLVIFAFDRYKQRKHSKFSKLRSGSDELELGSNVSE